MLQNDKAKVWRKALQQFQMIWGHRKAFEDLKGRGEGWHACWVDGKEHTTSYDVRRAVLLSTAGELWEGC